MALEAEVADHSCVTEALRPRLPLAGDVIWYDILGVTPAATADDIRLAFEARSRLLDTGVLGESAKIVAAVNRARALLDQAYQILRDPGARSSYDQEVLARSATSGLAKSDPVPSEPGLDMPVGVLSYRESLPVVTAALVAIADWLAPHHEARGKVVVPDFRGLPISLCMRCGARAGLRVQLVQLTKNPLPVEGVVVHQTPPAGDRVRRSSTLTIEVWHPPAPPQRV